MLPQRILFLLGISGGKEELRKISGELTKRKTWVGPYCSEGLRHPNPK